MTKNGKLFTKIGTAIVGIAMAIGVGVAASSGSAREARAADNNTTYSQITAVGQLEAGKSYLITDGTSGTINTMATTDNANNRPTTSLTVTAGVVTRGANAMSVTLGGSTDAWTFATDNYAGTAGYLNASNSTNKNYLKVVADLDDYAYFTISFSNGAAVITCTGKDSRNIVRCNTDGTPISCYSSGQNPVYLFKENEQSSEPDFIFDNTAVSLKTNNTVDGVTKSVVPSNVENPVYSWTTSSNKITLDPETINTATVKVLPNADEECDAVVNLTASGSNIGNQNYSFTVHLVYPYGEVANHPYSVSQARDAIDAGTGLEDVYTTGKIYEVSSFSDQYHSITYWISEDGTGSSASNDGLEVYGGLNIGGSQFASIDDLKVGDVVVVRGELKKFSSTYEYDKNNVLISLSREGFHSVSFAGITNASVTGPATIADGENLSLTINAAEHYSRPTELTVTMGGDALSPSTGYTYNSGTGAFSITGVTGDVVITGACIENPKYTITYVHGEHGTGDDYVDPEQQYAGQYTLLGFGATGFASDSGYSFNKWSVGGVEYAAGAEITITGNTTVTAVYKEAVSYALVTNASALVAGTQFILVHASENNIAINGFTPSYFTITNNVSINGNNATSDDAMVFTLEGSAGAWKIKSDSYYYGIQNSTNALRNESSDGNNYSWTISITDGVASLKTAGSGTRSLCYNSNSPRFSAYTASNSYTEVRMFAIIPAQNELDSVTTTGQNTAFTAGNTFSYGGTLTAHYTVDADATVLPSTFKIGNQGIDPTSAGTLISDQTVLTKAEHDGKYVYVLYAEDDIVKYASYQITVNYAAVSSVSITTHAASIGLGGEYNVSGLAVSVEGQYADPGYEWVVSSSTIDELNYAFDGSDLVVAQEEGTITLRVRSTADNTKYDELVITVSSNASVTLDKDSASAYAGDDVQFAYASSSNMGTITSYAWEIVSGSDKIQITGGEDAATVSIKCNNPGSATIKLTVSDGVLDAEKTATITIAAPVVDIEDATNGATLYLGTAEKAVTFTPTVTPHGVISRDLLWESSNPEVASVENGVVTGLTAGTGVTITATTASGSSKEYTVDVKAPDSIKVTAPTKVDYKLGESFDKTGFAVKAVFGQVEKDAVGYSEPNPDMTREGTQTITITLLGKTDTFDINISKDQHYAKVTAASDLKAGDKLLLAAVKEDASKVATGISGTNKFLDVTDVTIANDKIEKTNAMEAYELILGGQEGTWTLGNSEGKVLGVTAAQSARLAWVDPTSETAHTWTITLSDDDTFEIKINGVEGGALQYNSSNPRFTNYTTNQVKPLLFKLADSGDQPGPGPVAPTLSKIEIESMPTKTQYNIGDEFNQAGLSVKATYSDGSTKVISTGLTVTGFDSTAAGEKTLTVTYEGKTATFKVTVNDSTQPTTKTLAEINVRNTQDTYEYGQEIDKTKLTVTAVYSDGTSATVTDYTLSGYNKNQSGQQTVTVSYSEDGVTKTATFTVTVGAQPADAVEAARQAALRELQAYVANLGESNYSAENWARIQAYLQEAPEILAGLDTVERIEKYVTTFKNAMTAIPTIAEQEAAALADAKAVALADLKEYYDSFDQSQYDEAGVAALAAAYNDGKDAIEAATTTDAIDAAVRNAKAAMDAVAKKPSAPARRCGGDIAATSIILSTIALAGAGLLVFKKRKED